VANSFLKPEIISRAMLGLLERDIVLPRFVWRDAEADFRGRVGPKGDTVTIRVPARTAAHEYAWRNDRSSGITMDELTEDSVDVKLTHDVYNGIPITDEELTLDIGDFGSQVLAPQTRAVAEYLENLIAAEMTGATYANTLTVDTSDPYKTLVDARALLNKANVPFADRFCVIGADVESAMLKSDHLANADTAGDSQALRDASVGRMAGFNVFVTNSLPANVGFAFHRTAYPAVFRAPVVPDGATFGQSAAYGGIAMRWIKDYDATHLQDRSIVSTFFGVTHVTDNVVNPADPDSTAADIFVRSVKLAMPEDTEE